MPLKKSQIEKTSKSLTSKELKNMTITYDGEVFKYDEIALLVIDVQEEFCDPKHKEKRGNEDTVRISERIQSIIPEFRKASIPIYAVYFSYTEIKDKSKIDFFKFKPLKSDILVRKTTDSAFQGSNIDELLKKKKKRLLLTCGFNLNACVERTVKDATERGFKVCVLEDLSGNGQMSFSQKNWPISYGFIKGKAVSKRSSEIVLEILKNPANSNNRPKLWDRFFRGM